jgi:translation initiation factor 1
MDFNKIFLQNDISQFDTPQFNNKIDIYVKQRNGKKCITMIEGLPEDKDKLKAYAKDLRKKLGCSCSVISEKDVYILKLSGKDTGNIINYLTNNLDIKHEDITIHGDI